MDIGVLGPLRLLGPRGEIELRGLRERLLVAHLVVAAGRTVSPSTLIDGLWGDDPPRTAGKSLQNVVLRVRKAFEPERSLVVTETTGYRLAIEQVTVDAHRFESLAGAGAWHEALDLWRGTAYAGLEDAPVLATEARRLEELRAAAMEARVAVDLEAGAEAATVADLEGLVGRYPTRERLWALLMTALYRQGRQADALAAYERARATLAADLGLDPGPELRDLQSRVLAQDPTLDARPARPVLPAALTPAPGALVGREHELAVLHQAWAQARAGSQPVVVLRGPIGAGEQRLAATFAAAVAGEAGQIRYDGPRDAETGSGHGGPALLVRGRGAPVVEAPTGPALRVELTGPDGDVPDGAMVIDLAPLSREEVRRLVADVAPPAALDAVTDHAVAASNGWPGSALAAAVSYVREQAAAAVATASSTADAAAATLVDARAQMVDSVLDMQAATAGRLPADRCPWPGLAAYGQEDGPWFAGRERLVAELAARLAGATCLAVVGSSGSGKSSVVYAGLLAGLADGLLPGSSGWDLLTLRPGRHPVAELARVVLGARRPDVGDVLERLVRDGSGDGGRTVLIVDQLEEVWTACEDEGERAAFLGMLAGLVADGGSPVVLVLVIRADYLDRLADQPALAAAAGDNTVLVGTPTADEARRAVLNPATRAGLTLEEGLLDAVVTDAGAEPGLLPLLSTSLRRLWERREGGRLTLAAYVATDGLRGAIAHLAESEYARLDPEGQRDVRSLLLRLAGPGEGNAVTRRRVPRTELAALPRDPAPLVERLAAARLLTVSDDYVEVAHEALFREWPRLRGWLEDDRTSREAERRLAVAAEEWRAEGEDAALLWRGARLEAGLELAAARPEETTSVERSFLNAGRSAAEEARLTAERRAEREARQNRRLRVILAGCVVLLVVAALAATAALRSREREAEAAADSARSAIAADAKRLAASALSMEQADLALLTAVEATRDEQSPETYGAVLTLLARQPDVVTRIRTPNRFFSVATDRRGETVYLGENSPVLSAVDPATGEVRWRRDDLAGMPGGLAVSPDGRTVAVVLLVEDGDQIVILDATTGGTEHTITLAEVNGMTGGAAPYLWAGGGFTDAGRFVVATDDAVVLVSARGRLLGSIPWPRQVFDDGSFLVWPDGQVSVGGTDADGDTTDPAIVLDTERAGAAPREVAGEVRAVDRRTHRIVVTRPTPSGAELVLLDARTFQPESNAWPADPETGVVRFSADGGQLLVGAGERVELRDGVTGAPIRELVGHNGPVVSGEFTGAGNDLVWTAGLDGTAVGFDLTGRRGVFATTRTQDTPWAGEGAARADTIVWTDRIETDVNHVYLLRRGEERGRRLDAGLASCRCDATSSDVTADGGLALAGYALVAEDYQPVPDEGYVVVWDTRTRAVRGVVRTPWPVYGLDSSADGSRAVVVGGDGWGVLDLAELTLDDRLDAVADLDTWRRQGTGTSLAEVSPDGTRAALLVEGDVLLVDLDGLRVLKRRQVETGPTGFAQSAAWTNDGSALAVGTTNGWFHVLDGDTLESVVPRRLVTSGVLTDVEVSPDGTMAATIGPEGDVTLWDTATWRPYGQPLYDGGSVGFLRFTRAGDRLEVRLSDQSLSLVAVDPHGWVEAACQAAARDLTADEWAVLRPGVEQRSTCDRDETAE